MEGALPYIDQHEITLDVPVEGAWPFVIAVFERLATRRAWCAFAKALRCNPDRVSGNPTTVGATVPGFRVTRSVRPNEWALEGRHLFSRYELTFRIVPQDDGHCQVQAESHAAFPGLHGMAYRALVIGTRGHVIAVSRILQRIKKEAERPTERSTPG